MFTKYVTFVVIILNSHVIDCESQILFNYNKDNSKPSNENHNEMQNIIEQTLEKKLEQLENNLNTKIKETIDSAFQNMANDSAIRQVTMIQAMAIESAIRQTTMIQAIVNDNASRHTAMIQTIANLTNVIQTLDQKLTKLENRTLDNGKGNATNSGSEDTSGSRLLHVTVPSSVHVRTDVWKYREVPVKDDLDMYMTNVTGCTYRAREGNTGGLLQKMLAGTAHGGRWLRFAARGKEDSEIRVQFGPEHYYSFRIGHQSNTQTNVYDIIRGTYLLQRATPSVMSQDRYTPFYYIHLEDGVISFGALDESSPWLRHRVRSLSQGDTVDVEYATSSRNGLKLLVCV